MVLQYFQGGLESTLGTDSKNHEVIFQNHEVIFQYRVVILQYRDAILQYRNAILMLILEYHMEFSF